MKQQRSDVLRAKHTIRTQRVKVLMRIGILFLLCLLLSSSGTWAETLRIATDQWGPYENLSDPQAPGFSTEVIQAVFASMGIDITIREYPWKRALQEVYDGESDAVYSGFWSEERAQYCYFPKEPLIQEQWIFFIKQEHVGTLTFSSYEDLKGKRIGVIRGASVTPEFWEFAKQQLYTVEEVTLNEQNFQKLVDDRLDYVVTSYAGGITLINSMGLGEQVVPLTEKSVSDEPLYVMFSKKTVTPERVNKFSAALQAFKTTETYQAIYNKYFTVIDEMP